MQDIFYQESNESDVSRDDKIIQNYMIEKQIKLAQNMWFIYIHLT